jgi:TRAP transporter 4TM/12TM fusion protein
MLGSVSWPMLRRAGYPRDTAGAVLSAAGIGAILAPPAMGAAAFLIAEFLKISYLQVIGMAALPAFLYYLSVFLMVETDSRRLGTIPLDDAVVPLGELTRRSGYYFLPLAAVVVLLVAGVSTFRAVFWATMLAFALSFVRRDTALTPRRALAALDGGGRGVLAVAATTATAGIIVGIVTLTGLGLKVAGLIVTLAGGHAFLTAVYGALAVWLLGLAVPVTASYIIAAVMVAPAMINVGVAPFAAHMFIFYYAVLSEVSPPTALAPFAAAALTGGHPFKTMMLTWKYTLPAFLVPFAFTLDPQGLGLLLRAPLGDIVWSAGTAVIGIFALAAGFGGWMRRAASRPERALAVAGGLLLFYPAPVTDAAGLSLTASAAFLHHWRIRAAR